MTASPARRTLLRNHGGGPAPVSYLELFFDLVYVFALTQISHMIVERMSWLGLIEAAVAFAAVWWAWIYTAWFSNWLDPEQAPVRMVLLLVMLASMLMAVALPHAFDGGAPLFAFAYVLIQVGRTLFLARALTRAQGESGTNMWRASLWFAASGAFWIAGALTGSSIERLACWVAALAIEYAGPSALFYVPFLGRSTVTEWTISGHHMAERAALFIIIALGEGIVVTGRTFAEHTMSNDNVTAFVIAFAGSVTMWWVYFDLGAKRGAELIEHHAEPGRVARDAYTYLHMPIVGGIIGTAVADELLLAHPNGPAEWPFIAFQCGGLAVFLTGVGLFKRIASPTGRFPLSHLVGLCLLAPLAAWGIVSHVPVLPFAALSVVVLMLVALWEWVSFHGGWAERVERVSPALAQRLAGVGERPIASADPSAKP